MAETQPSAIEEVGSVVEVKDPEFPHITYRIIASIHSKKNTIEEFGTRVGTVLLEDCTLESYNMNDPSHLAEFHGYSAIDTQYAKILTLAHDQGLPVFHVDVGDNGELSSIDRRRFLRHMLGAAALAICSKEPAVPPLVRTVAGATVAVKISPLVLAGATHLSGDIRKLRSLSSQVFRTMFRAGVEINGYSKFLIEFRNVLLAYKGRVAARNALSSNQSESKAVFPVGLGHVGDSVIDGGIPELLKKSDNELLKKLGEMIPDLIKASKRAKIPDSDLRNMLFTIPVTSKVQRLYGSDSFEIQHLVDPNLVEIIAQNIELNTINIDE